MNALVGAGVRVRIGKFDMANGVIGTVNEDGTFDILLDSGDDLDRVLPSDILLDGQPLSVMVGAMDTLPTSGGASGGAASCSGSSTSGGATVDVWICSDCTQDNPRTIRICRTCGADAPVGQVPKVLPPIAEALRSKPAPAATTASAASSFAAGEASPVVASAPAAAAPPPMSLSKAPSEAVESGLSPADAAARATTLKEEGNRLFGDSHILAASESYRRGLSLVKSTLPAAFAVGDSVIINSLEEDIPARTGMIATIETDGTIEVMYDDDDSEEHGIPLTRVRPMTEDAVKLYALRKSLLSNLARCALKLESFEDCVRFLTDAMEYCDPDATLYYLRAKAHNALRMNDEAHDDVVHCLKLDPKNQPARALLATVNQCLAASKAVDKKLVKAFSKHFESSGALDALGRTYR